MNPRERIYIVPTPAGAAFAVLVFLVFALGYFIGGFGGPPQALVVSLLVAGIIAMFQTNENLRGISVVSCRSEPVEAGTDAVLTLAVANASAGERLGLRVGWREGWKIRGGARIPVLRAGETQSVSLRIPTARRGRHPVPEICVSSVLPVALCFAWKLFPQRGFIYAFPRGCSWCPPPTGSGGGAGRKAAGGDVGGHRAYVPGDMLSRLDWRVFARTGKPVVRTLEGGGAARVVLRWEDTGFLADPEDRLSQLGFWVSECARAGRPFDLHIGGRAFSERNITGCRIALAEFGSPA
jgi:uncharacterized protein (DUF58 family)